MLVKSIELRLSFSILSKAKLFILLWLIDLTPSGMLKTMPEQVGSKK